MNRPMLSTQLSPEEFASWYWLKQELVDFCRCEHIVSSGLKRDIEVRIKNYLAGAQLIPEDRPRRRSGRMPAEFTLNTVIGSGWRCGPALGRFLKGVLGNGFRFNAEMREFIHRGEGKTLPDAAICYVRSIGPDREKRQIPQLEYNRHFREYFKEHPEASREEAILAWWALRNRRRE
jgi:hypothetical protein